jgi:hypothetical protein
MLSEALKQAQIAIEDDLRKAGEPIEARKVLENIKECQDIREIDLREAMWFLIGQGKISLAWDWKLSLVECTDTHLK